MPPIFTDQIRQEQLFLAAKAEKEQAQKRAKEATRYRLHMFLFSVGFSLFAVASILAQFVHLSGFRGAYACHHLSV
jgi:hypothetical protein